MGFHQKKKKKCDVLLEVFMTFWGITRLNKEHFDPFLDLAEIIYGSLGANGLNT